MSATAVLRVQRIVLSEDQTPNVEVRIEEPGGEGHTFVYIVRLDPDTSMIPVAMQEGDHPVVLVGPEMFFGLFYQVLPLNKALGVKGRNGHGVPEMKKILQRDYTIEEYPPFACEVVVYNIPASAALELAVASVKITCSQVNVGGFAENWLQA